MTDLSKVAVIGSTGQLGTDVVQILSNCGRYEITPLSETQIDVTDHNSVKHSLGKGRFEAVINCAAYTRVDESRRRGNHGRWDDHFPRIKPFAS